MTDAENLSFVYMTAGNSEEARRIARALVEERLAACVNILGPMNSFYEWNGVVQDDQEVVLIAKTRRSKFAPLCARAKELHSYEVPCIVELPLQGGYAPFLEFIERQTKNRSAE
jgi:periplasmic divalent cation tolerance protein